MLGRVRNLSIPSIPAEESNHLTASQGLGAKEFRYRGFVTCHCAFGIENMIYSE
jgi:hypothetical protein